MNNDEVSKAEKEEQKKQTLKNKKAKFKFVQAQKDNKDALEKGKVLKYDKETGEYDYSRSPTLKVKIPYWEGNFKGVELYDDEQKQKRNSSQFKR